jgi:hypothetical protein
MRPLAERAREAAEGCKQRHPHATCGSTCSSVVIPELLAKNAELQAEVERLKDGRVSCKGCAGKDTAATSNALCYTCRNQPLWELDDAKQSLRPDQNTTLCVDEVK